MVSLIKDLSILRKFLFINLIVFIVIGILTVAYLKSIQPGLIKKKTSNHIRVIDNTIKRPSGGLAAAVAAAKEVEDTTVQPEHIQNKNTPGVKRI